MKNRRRKLQKTTEPEKAKESQESKKDDSRRAILDDVVDKRRKLEDIPNEINEGCRDEDAAAHDNKTELQIEMGELSAAKEERENDVQSIQKVQPNESVEGKDKSREEAMDDLEKGYGMLPIKECAKEYPEKSLEQGINKGNDLTTDDSDDNDINENNNCGYTCQNSQALHTCTISPSTGDGTTYQLVANSSNQVKKPKDLVARFQDNTCVPDELDLPGKKYTEATCVGLSIEKKRLKNPSKEGDEIIDMSCEVSEKVRDLLPQTDKKLENDSYENQNRASKNDIKINKQSAVNACHTSDMSCLVNTTEIYMVPDEIHSCPTKKSEAENLNPSPDRMVDSDMEGKPDWGLSPTHHLVDCLFDEGEVYEPELEEKVNNPEVASADITGRDKIHSDKRQDKDFTDSQLCDVDWMSQFPEEISPNEPVQGYKEEDQSGTASSKILPAEDGSAIMAGFIKELSQLNKMLLKTKREMENVRRQKKTSSNM